ARHWEEQVTRLRIATRGSALARWQADHVAALLHKADPAVEAEVVVVETSGDRRLDVPIWELGGKGVFVKEVQAAVLDGRADLAVHSAKDLPSATPEALVIAAVPERADVRDALVGATLADLPEGAVVATGSLRRRAQIAHARPDLRFEGLRGNMATRVARAGTDGVAAVVVAAAALDRLAWGDRIAERLAVDVVLPQVGQAALAVECRADDARVRTALAAIEDGPSRRAVDAERGFLAELGGDCSVPAAAYAEVAGRGTDADLTVRGLVATVDGAALVRHEVWGAARDGEALGRALARHLLDDQGGAELLGRTSRP
ncbi:MAG TPA: hydroxymethylbilane synthase, partial [Acidimicrobiales bacterium]|nr:hydroxymethylbilane synthase [Acidimicrobiales bacterium]